MRQRISGATEPRRPSRKAAKSSSVRLSPTVLRTVPAATSKAAIRVCVPCRRYSNSCRSTLPGRMGRSGGHPLKRLDAGHFVNRYRAHRPRIFQRPTVNRADIGAFGLEIRIRFGRQPRARQMGLEVGSFLKSAPHGGAKDDPRDPVSPPRGQDRSHSSGSAEDRSPWVACRPGQ